MATATTDELALLFDISVQKVRELGRSGVLLKKGRGAYDRDASTTRYIAHLRSAAAGYKSQDGKLDATEENALLRRSQRELNEIKKASLERDLIPVGEIAPAWQRVAMATRGAVMAIPGKARARLPHLTIHDGEVLAQVCRDALEDASMVLSLPGADSGEPDADDESEEDEDDQPGG